MKIRIKKQGSQKARLHLADVTYCTGVVKSREQRKNIHVD